MKKYVFLLALAAISISLSAQQGLFDISYDDPVYKADSLLMQFSFKAAMIDGYMVKYYAKNDPMVEAVILFIKPDTKTVAGWFVKHWASNTDEMDEIVVRRMYQMHREPTMYDEDTDQMIWAFNLDRSAHLLFVGDGSLCVLYADSRYNELFQVDQWQQDLQEESEVPAEKEAQKGAPPETEGQGAPPPEFNPPPTGQ
ncbi:MAG: hypothetical protein WBI94_04535 [Candidatus Cloacimonadaceae bacterium]